MKLKRIHYIIAFLILCNTTWYHIFLFAEDITTTLEQSTQSQITQTIYEEEAPIVNTDPIAETTIETSIIDEWSIHTIETATIPNNNEDTSVVIPDEIPHEIPHEQDVWATGGIIDNDNTPSEIILSSGENLEITIANESGEIDTESDYHKSLKNEKNNQKKYIFGPRGKQAVVNPNTLINGDPIELNTPAFYALYNTEYIEDDTLYEVENDNYKSELQYDEDPLMFGFGKSWVHYIFSEPIALHIPVPEDNKEYSIEVLHEWDKEFNSFWLSTDPNNACNPDWWSSIPGNITISSWGFIVFYTCGASTFILNPNNTGGTDSLVWLKANAWTNTTTQWAAVTSRIDQVDGTIYNKIAWWSAFAFQQTGINRNSSLLWNNTRAFLISTANASAANRTVFSVLQSTSLSNASDLIGNTSTIIRNEQRLNSASRWFNRATIEYTSSLWHIANSFELMTVDHANTSTNVNYQRYALNASNSSSLNVWSTTAPLTDQRVGNTFNGNLAEVIMYNYVLSATEKQKVQSYLAVKYGITMTQNYLSTDNTTTYNVSSYGYDIAWIGRDDASTLYQKQSQSINTNNLGVNTGNIIFSLWALASSNQNNTQTFSNDKSFVIAWHDNGSLARTNNQTEYERSIRKRKVTETNTIWTIRISVPATMFNPRSGSLYLLTDSNDDFIGFTWYEMTLSNGMRYIDIDMPLWTSYISFGWKRGNVCIYSPVSYSTGIISKNIHQIIEYQFDYFIVNDSRWSNSWYYSTISMSNLSGVNGIIPNTQINRKADPITTLSGTTNPNVLVAGPMSSYHPANTTETFIYRSPWINNNLKWSYGSRLWLQINIPAYTAIGSYTGVITYTLYEN